MSHANPVRRTTTSVDVYLAGDDLDGSLTTLDDVIREALPHGARALWEGVFWGGTEQTIIGYGDITQPRPGGKTASWFLIGLARQSRHFTLYVNAAEGRDYLSKQYGPQLGKTKVGAASIAFKSASDLDLDTLADMVRHAGRIVEHH